MNDNLDFQQASFLAGAEIADVLVRDTFRLALPMLINCGVNITRENLLCTAQTLYAGAFDFHRMKVQVRAESRTPRTPRQYSKVIECYARDSNSCIVTGRQFATEVAHILPYGLGCDYNSRENTFWRTIEMFLGVSRTDYLYSLVAGPEINSLRNLFVIDRSLHRMFDTGSLALVPVSKDLNVAGPNYLLPDYNYNEEEFYVMVEYRGKNTPPKGSITSTKELQHMTSHITETTPIHANWYPLVAGSLIPIKCSSDEYFFPHPALFQLHHVFTTISEPIRAAAELAQYPYCEDLDQTSVSCVDGVDPKQLHHALQIIGESLASLERLFADQPVG
jgi:hypothetical protein